MHPPLALDQKSTMSWLLGVSLLTLSITSQTWAQSATRSGSGSATRSGSMRQSTSGSTTRVVGTQETFEVRLWNYLQRAQYKHWAPVPGNSDDAYAGTSPHGAMLKMYLNRRAAGRPRELLPGSLLVKENYAEDGRTLMAITVMSRAKPGYDPQHYDWYWVKYNPDGTVARTPPDKGSRPIMGKFASCINCHADAAGGDYAFFND